MRATTTFETPGASVKPTVLAPLSGNGGDVRSGRRKLPQAGAGAGGGDARERAAGTADESHRQGTEAIETTREEIDLLNEAKQQDIDLSTPQGQAWLEAAKRNRRLSAALGTVEQLYSQTRTGAELYASELQMLNSPLRNGLISQDLVQLAE